MDKKLEKLAEEGNVEAMYKLGVAILEDAERRTDDGEGPDDIDNLEDGYAWLEEAYNKGCAKALEKAVEFFDKGVFDYISCEQALYEVVQFTSKADHAFSNYCMGRFCEFGIDGWESNRQDEAVTFYQKAVDLGAPYAKPDLARVKALNSDEDGEKLLQEIIDGDYSNEIIDSSLFVLGFIYLGGETNKEAIERADKAWSDLPQDLRDDIVDAIEVDASLAKDMYALAEQVNILFGSDI